MSFLQPGLALAAIVVAAIPLLLHLLLRRPRVTAWPSTMLLRRALERLRRRRRLEQWVLLAMRSLALALIGLGMAGPIARAMGGLRASRELWVVIDDGATSAERLPDGTRALDAVRAQVRMELDRLRAGDRVALVRAARPVEVRVQPTVDVERVRRELDALQPCAVPGDLAAAIEKCLPVEADARSASREVLLASSFRRGSVDPDVPLPASWKARTQGVGWIAAKPIEFEARNRSIQMVTVGRGADEMRGAGEIPVRVDMTRSGGGSEVDPLMVRGATGELLGRGDVSWGSGTTDVRQDIRIRAPGDGAMVVEAAADAQPLDDIAAVVSGVSGAPRVCVLGRRGGDTDIERLPASTWITRSLEAAGVQPQELDPSTLALRPPRDAETVIVARPDLLDAAGWSWIGRFTRDGGTTVLLPVPELPTQAWMTEAERALSLSVTQDPGSSDGSFRLAARQPRGALLSLLGAEVDALAEPVSLQRRWMLRSSGTDLQPVLLFEDGTPAVVMSRPRDGTGVVVQFAFAPDLSVTDLPLKPLMVPLFQEISRSGRGIAAAQQACWSGEIAWIGSSAAGGLLRSMDGATVIEIDSEGRTVRAIPTPGLWRVEQRDGRRRWIAARLDPRSASIERVQLEALDAWRSAVGPWVWCAAGDQDETVSATPDASPWTFPLLAGALVLLLAECGWSRRASPHRRGHEVPA